MDSAAGQVKEAADAGLRPAVVVTGASSGIGLELARIAAGEAEVVLIARSQDRLDALAADIARNGGRAHALALDLAIAPAAPAIAAFLAARNLYCDVLVNNAGFGLVGPAEQLDRDEQLAIIDLNVRASTELALAFLPGMIERRRGGILNVASTASYLPGPYMAVYYASKAFMRSFSEALWEECRSTGVHVTALCPGPVETEFFARAAPQAKKPKVFRLLPNDDARTVAEAGWRGFRADRRAVIPGFVNKLGVFAARLTPTRALLAVMRKFQKRRPEDLRKN